MGGAVHAGASVGEGSDGRRFICALTAASPADPADQRLATVSDLAI